MIKRAGRAVPAADLDEGLCPELTSQLHKSALLRMTLRKLAKESPITSSAPKIDSLCPGKRIPSKQNVETPVTGFRPVKRGT